MMLVIWGGGGEKTFLETAQVRFFNLVCVNLSNKLYSLGQILITTLINGAIERQSDPSINWV